MAITGKEVFVLSVIGDSMIDEHIVDGDFVMVEKIDNPNHGEIVVYNRIASPKISVKQSLASMARLYKKDNKFLLKPSNSEMESLLLAPEEVSIQGRVIGVLRKF